MKLKKLRLYVAGLVAFVAGMPLTEKAFADTGDVVDASLGLASAIIDSAGRS